MRLVEITDEPIDEGFPPREKDSVTTFYHGTNSEQNARGILKTGIDPAATDIKYGDKKRYLRPQAGKIYMTPHLNHAMIYAMGGCFAGSTYFTSKLHQDPKLHSEHGRFGFVFVIDGNSLTNIAADEDSIGGTVANYFARANFGERGSLITDDDFNTLRSSSVWQTFLHLLPSIVTEIQYKELHKKWGKMSEIAHQANLGKKISTQLEKRYPRLAVSLHQLLIDIGAHVAHHGVVRPVVCYAFDKTMCYKLASDGSNFKDIAFVWNGEQLKTS